MSILVQGPTLGLNALLEDNQLDVRAAANGSMNALYERGILKTPYGFAKLDLTTGLDSGTTVLHVFQFRELDNYTHILAVTTNKIYEHNRNTDSWDDITQSGISLSANITKPVSYTEIAHTDAIPRNDTTGAASQYFHLLVCDGGLTNIQRWAGRVETDFADLLGGSGYHDGTTHRAEHVGHYKNRTILLNPSAYSSTSRTWIENKQRVRWPMVGYIEDYTGSGAYDAWSGTGSGFVDLMDTGGRNLWAAKLGGLYIIYQTQGIWSLNYIGGTSVFDPIPQIPDVGLLAPHLLINRNNVHYFMGTDYNIYSYYGGSVYKKIGDEIRDFILEDLEKSADYKCWMTLDASYKNLWIFIVVNNDTYITKAYGMNLKTQSWQVRDFGHVWSTGGITAVSLVGSESYMVGETYQEALDQLSLYQHDATKDAVYDATLKFGDELLDTSRALTVDMTAGTWTAGGFDYSLAAENFKNEFTTNDMMVVYDGSNGTNLPYGTHFYTVYDVSTNGLSVKPTADVSSNDRGIADNSTNVPADMSVAGADTIGFFSTCAEDDPGDTYRRDIEEILVNDRLILGDNAGYVYQFDPTYTTEDGENIPFRHITPVYDLQLPDIYKRWPGIVTTSKGSKVNVEYKIDNGQWRLCS